MKIHNISELGVARNHAYILVGVSQNMLYTLYSVESQLAVDLQL